MTYRIDKILKKSVRRGVLEYLIRWRGYTADFDSWMPASSVKMDNDPKHFYVTLFSNASQNLYPDNTLSVYSPLDTTYRPGFDRQVGGWVM